MCAKAATKISLLSFYICYPFCLKLDARIFFLIICRINFAVATNKKLFSFSLNLSLFAGSECLIKLVKFLILLRFDQHFKSQHSTIFESVCVSMIKFSLFSIIRPHKRFLLVLHSNFTTVFCLFLRFSRTPLKYGFVLRFSFVRSR